MRGEVGRGLIIAPRNLVRQWMEELREKLALTAWFYDGRYLTDVGGRVRESRAPLDEDGLLITDLRAVATDNKFSVFQERLTQVLDEGHRVIAFTQYLGIPGLPRQYLPTTLDVEPDFIVQVADEPAATNLLISHNGKTFNLPLLSTRLQLAGSAWPSSTTQSP